MDSNELKALIARHIPEAQVRVERAVKQWNPILREHLRAETGLRLHDGKNAESVRVRVENGMPASLAQAIANRKERIELLLLVRTFEGGSRGLKALKRSRTQILRQDLSNGLDVSEGEIDRISNFLDITIQNINKEEFLEALGKIKEDLLGRYLIKEARIFVYWMPLALLARLIGVRIEALTVITLAHELAHAFTHLGYDIDGENWNTEAFCKADSFICEGLAEWYTEEVCRKVGERQPDIWNAYETESQVFDPDGPYAIHRSWSKDHKAPKEVIRLALLKCRKLGLTKYEEFEKLLIAECKAMPTAVGKQDQLFR